jgi:hypothetical protein
MVCLEEEELASLTTNKEHHDDYDCDDGINEIQGGMKGGSSSEGEELMQFSTHDHKLSEGSFYSGDD